MIHGVGPRYCPSIEDKVVRFAAREKHQIFVEPTGLETDEMYLGGFSTSLPEAVQIQLIHSVRGLENALRIITGYMQPVSLTEHPDMRRLLHRG